jgi:hypothetical protein
MRFCRERVLSLSAGGGGRANAVSRSLPKGIRNLRIAAEVNENLRGAEKPEEVRRERYFAGRIVF